MLGLGTAALARFTPSPPSPNNFPSCSASPELLAVVTRPQTFVLPSRRDPSNVRHGFARHGTGAQQNNTHCPARPALHPPHCAALTETNFIQFPPSRAASTPSDATSSLPRPCNTSTQPSSPPIIEPIPWRSPVAQLANLPISVCGRPFRKASRTTRRLPACPLCSYADSPTRIAQNTQHARAASHDVPVMSARACRNGPKHGDRQARAARPRLPYLAR